MDRVPNPRTLRREFADTGVSDLARVVSRAYYPFADEAVLAYLDVLDWVLDDQYIDARERAALDELAADLNIPPKTRESAHRSYLASIIAAAERDGITTESEARMVALVADALGVTDVVRPVATGLAAGGQLREGMRVCFTGQAIVDGKELGRPELEELAACCGLQPVASVTKRGCDLVVTADRSSMSGKAKRARKYSIPVIEAGDFVRQIEGEWHSAAELHPI